MHAVGAWRGGKDPRTRADRGRGCAALWCSGGKRSTKGATKDLPRHSSSKDPHKQEVQLARMKAAFAHFRRFDLTSMMKANPEARPHYSACKCHFGDDGEFIPLHLDPIFRGDTPECLLLEKVLEHHSSFSAELTAVGGHWMDSGLVEKSQLPPDVVAAIKGSCTPENGRSREARAAIRSLRLEATGCLPMKDVLPAMATTAQRLVESSEIEMAKLRKRVEELEMELAESEAERACMMHPLSYDSLVSGKQAALCRLYAKLPAVSIEAVVLSAEAMHLDDAWAAVVRNEPNVARQRILDFGFRNGVAFVFVRCCLGLKAEVMRWSFNLYSIQLVSQVFKITLLVCNFLFEKTVARVPDMAQVDRDTMPAFSDGMFTNSVMIADATDVSIQGIHNPIGNDKAHSDYYNGCCAKVEFVCGPDAKMLWASKAYGGKASEIAIMSDGGFEKWFAQFLPSCVGEDGEQFVPGMMADKGTRIGSLCTKIGATYMTPSNVAGGTLTHDEIQSNELIAKARSHVERVIGNVKHFKILTNGSITSNMVAMIDDIIYFCAFATSFEPNPERENDTLRL